MRRTQKGFSTVELAIVANVILVIIVGAIEVGRAYFVYATLDEVTRRGARLAAVCPVNDPGIRQMAVFNASGDTSNSQLVPALAPGHVVVEYLDRNSAVVTNPSDPGAFAEIRYVRVRVVGFQHQLAVPYVTSVASFPMPEFPAVLPRESLGIPRDGVITAC